MQRSSCARYQWPVFEPVRADTGTLRILPGSHHREFQWAVRQADIPDVGGQFDPDEFIATLDKARVNSVTLCAGCHHGHLIHPNLPRSNLLLEQIEACQKNDIR